MITMTVKFKISIYTLNLPIRLLWLTALLKIYEVNMESLAGTRKEVTNKKRH